MILEEDGIRLRPWSEGDVPAIVEACQDEEIPRWTRVPSPYTEADARGFVATADERAFAIVDPESDELLGSIAIHPDDSLGYWLRREARGRGVASRALALVSRWALTELGLPRVWLVAEPENVASQRVAEKAGFSREGLRRSFMELKGRRRDYVMYSLLPEDV